MTEYVVLYERSTDGDWGAYVPDLPGIAVVGSSRAEAEALVADAIEIALAWDRDHDRTTPAPAHQAGTLQVPART